MRFVAVGHVTNDVLAGGIVAGGSVLYAGLAARGLGAEIRIITSHGPDFVGCELPLEVVPAARTTTFENVYEGGRRRQRVRAIAAPLVTPVAGADVVFACPVAGEIADSAMVKPARGILAAGLQGWLRAIDAEGVVSPRPLGRPAWLSACDVLFASDEDRAGELEARIVVITEGPRGAIVRADEAAHRVHAHPAREVDPTGAGDVFAAAFLVRLAAGDPPVEAAVFAACAASIVVEGPGATPLATGFADAVAARLAWYRVNVPAPARV